MAILFKAGMAFAAAALLVGWAPADNPRWRGVAAELAQAQPRAHLAAQLAGLAQQVSGVRN